MARDSARVSVAVTIPMCRPELISENSTRRGPIHVRPEAFGSSRVGAPPSTGTVHVSQESELPTDDSCVYATRDPSGVNIGAYLEPRPFVSCTASPFGRSLT